MRTLKSFWSNSPAEYKDYFFIYLWGVLWPAIYLLITPQYTFYIIHQIYIVLWTVTTALGGILAVSGLVFRDNLLLERLGVTLIMAGPVAYAVTQLGTLIFKTVTDIPYFGSPLNHVHLIFFALWPLLFLNKRRRQLKARVEISKKVPLESEKHAR